MRFLPQTKLAATYRTLAEVGRRDFYDGELAEAIEADLAAGGSVIRGPDLAAYRATVVEPLAHDYQGHRCYAVGGTGGGPMFIEALRRLSGRMALQPGADPGADDYVNFAEVLLAPSR